MFKRWLAQRKTKKSRPGDKLLFDAIELETRVMPSVFTPTFMRYDPAGDNVPASGSATPSGTIPSAMRQAYGVNAAMFGAIAGDGTGQTIAIVDAFDQPDIASDLFAFDSFYGLAAPPGLTKINENGGTTLPAPDAVGGWGIEISLDVEWAHVIAPNASILLVEANSASDTDLYTAVDTARNYAGVSVVSMSWSGDEASSDAADDYHFTTPSGHIGVTFVAATGDYGAYFDKGSTTAIVGYPAASPNVVAVGGTTLTAGAGGTYSSESGWGDGASSNTQGGSGGGISVYATQPTYQNGVVTQSSAYRTVPDVSLDANPNSGVPVYDTYDFGSTTPWAQYGGTSLATPMWAGVIAIADQGRVFNGLGTLDGPSQTLPKLYSLSASDFHDITTGNNGYAAGPGYDLVTGRGSPIVNLVVNDLAAASTPSIGLFTASFTTGSNGNQVALTASNVADTGATIKNVTFYREDNGQSGLQVGSDQFVGNGTLSGNHWTLNASTPGLAAGSYTYYAVATDSMVNTSAPASTSLTVTGDPPTYRVVTYNMEADINGATTPLAGFYQVLEGIGEEDLQGDVQPVDILTLEETTSNSKTVAPIVSALNTYYNGLAVYAQSTYQATQSGGNTDGNGPNALVYNTRTLTLLASVGVGTPHGSSNGEYRQVVRYEFQPVGDSGTAGIFYVYVSHMKSGSTSADATDRGEEATIIRNDEATLPANAAVLYTGDLNSTPPEAEFTEFAAAGQGEAFDPVNFSTSVQYYSESATDLRFRDDYELMTANVLNDTAGSLGYINGTLHNFGNNGTTPSGGKVNSGSDTALNSDLVQDGGTFISASTLYTALTTASDHLPVVADYTIVPVTTTTTLASSANPSVSGQSVTFTATVSPTVPQGVTVTFKDGSTTLGTATTNSSGVATFTISSLGVASHSIAASYAGDANFSGSTSSTVSETVNKGSSTTTIAAPTPNPSVFGQAVSFTVSVAAVSPGAGTPTGSVQLQDGGVNIPGASGTLSGGSATITVSSLSVETHANITAVYAGDSNFTTNMSSSASQTVNEASTTTTITANANPATLGQAVTFTATIGATAPGTGAPTGTVAFEDGGTILGSVALNAGGIASFTASTLALGDHPITAVYSGDSDFTGSTSAVVNEIVDGIWNNFNGNAQHTGISTVPAQPMDQILWQTSLDQQGTYFWHTGEPVFTPNDTVIVPIITSSGDNFELEAFSGATGALLWTAVSDYIQPSYSWLPPYQPVYDPETDSVYFAGPGGTLYYISHPDNPGSATPTPAQVAFFGTANYTANESAYNASIYINTPLTVDNAGNVFFGFTETGSNPSGINDGGIGRVSATGAGAYVTTGSAVGGGSGSPALGSAPAVSNDGSILYVAINDSNGPYLVGVNATTLAPAYAVALSVPNSNTGVELISQSTAAPMVAPDGTVFLGVFADDYDGSRGFMTHYSANLATEYTPGAFGWDDTASIIPTSMVPSYTGSSPYLILTKYNNYVAGETGASGGNGVNEIAVLDPYATETDPNNDPNPGMLVMKQILIVTSPTEDSGSINSGYPDATREWCTNGTAVDPATDSVFINNEDGYSYRWDLATDTITQAVEITDGFGEPYTPTVIGPNGVVYAINGGALFALGGYTNYTLTDVSSLDPSVAGQSVTFTTTLSSTNGGAVPAGSITFSYTSGVNNPLNSAPIALGTVSLVNGQATLTTAALIPDHYHIIASYSGDASDGYAAGSTTLVQVILANPTTTVTSSALPVDVGASVTFTAMVNPDGVFFVPLGTVSFMNGNTLLGTVPLNALDQSTSPSSSQVATFTTSSLPAGANSITAIYGGDSNFAGSKSNALMQVVSATPTISTTQLPAAIIAGGMIADQATVSYGDSPTGTVTFDLYNNATGTGPALFTDTENLVGGKATSASYATAAAGTDYWVATYNGDGNNNAVSSSNGGEPVTITSAFTVASVKVNGDYAPIVDISDSVSGSGPNFTHTVTVTTDGNHGFSSGNTVVIQGYTAGNTTGYNGTWTILPGAATNTFTYSFTNTSSTALTALTANAAGYAISLNTTSGLIGNQRSMVDSIAYNFAAPVTLTAADFTLSSDSARVTVNSGRSPSAAAPNVQLTSLTGGMIWVVTWVTGNGSTVTGHSIANGVFQITLGASNWATDTFFRLYGDFLSATSATVVSTDTTDYNLTFGKNTGTTGYFAGLDFAGTGSIGATDTTDYNLFFGTTWSGFSATI